MDILTVLVIAGLVHCCLFFFDTFFKSCSHFPYIYFLENTGFEVKFMRVQWFTTAFNRRIIKWGLNRSLFWTIWFDAGVIITVILLPLCLIATLIMTFNNLKSGAAVEKHNSGVSMELMLPGIGLPFNEIAYYVSTLAVCSITHEFGHVMAAAKESVQLHGMGILLVFILPIAYVNMNSNDLSPLPLRNQLRITCAGVWHNIILANVAAFIFFSSPWLWAPFYTSGKGVYVKTILPNSPVLGPTGLVEYNVIYQLNNCQVGTSNDWYNCVSNLIREPASGYCVKQSFVQEYDESVPSRQRTNGIVNCCTADSEASGSLCFEYIEGPQAAPLHLPPYSCLPARSMINQSDNYCQAGHDCTSHGGHCMRPLLDNTTKIVRIKRDKGEDVLFVGHPGDLPRTVHISNWIPKYFLFHPKLPESLALFCRYVIAFSYGMAFVNILPCFYFDGQYIINIMIRYVLSSKLYNKNTRQGITLTITSLGTILLAVNVFYLILNKLT